MPLLGIDDYEHIPESEDSPFIVPFRSGDSVDMSIASETLRSLISLAASAANLEVQSDPLKTFRNFLMVIGEALDNTIGHAYKPNIPKELRDVGRWWISGSVDPANRQLRFVVYDQGVTIPRALPYSNRFQSTQRFLRLLGIKSGAEDYAGDGAAIAAAVRVGASGTGLSFRGHGLTKMRDYIKGDRSGTLRIISRHGEYLAQTGLKDQFQARSVPLGGTLVEWTVNL